MLCLRVIRSSLGHFFLMSPSCRGQLDVGNDLYRYVLGHGIAVRVQRQVVRT